MIVVFSGPPCSGKSYIGEKLAAKRGWTHLEMDAIRMRLLPEAAHTRGDRVIAYRAMHYTAEMLARRGQPVIVNAVYGHRSDREEVRRCAAAADTKLYLVQFRVSVPIALERLRVRRERHPGLDLNEDRVRILVESFRYFQGGLVIDGEELEGRILEQIEGYLDAGVPLEAESWIAMGED
jgi:predicted kinase